MSKVATVVMLGVLVLAGVSSGAAVINVDPQPDMSFVVSDNPLVYKTYTFTVPAGTVQDVNVRFSALQTDYDSDLTVTLKHGNVVVQLFSAVGAVDGDGASAGFWDTLLDDQATNRPMIGDPNTPGANVAPFHNTYRLDREPGNNLPTLSAFNGMDASGTWYLFVNDTYDSGTLLKSGDTTPLYGKVLGTQLIIDGVTAPEPVTVAMVGVGALALVARRNRK